MHSSVAVVSYLFLPYMYASTTAAAFACPRTCTGTVTNSFAAVDAPWHQRCISLSNTRLPSSARTTLQTFSLSLTAAASAGNNDADNYIPMSPEKRPPRQGGDMSYVKDNIVRQMDTYMAIRKAGWPDDDCISDVYVRNPELNSFWYVGKVARCTGTVSLQQAVARQYNLIEEHATRLRPIELGRAFGSCEVWVAPGDTEKELSQNNPNIPLRKMERHVKGSEDVSSLEIGLNLEVVTNRGAGFFVERNNDGMVPPHLL